MDKNKIDWWYVEVDLDGKDLGYCWVEKPTGDRLMKGLTREFGTPNGDYGRYSWLPPRDKRTRFRMWDNDDLAMSGEPFHTDDLGWVMLPDGDHYR